MGILSRFALMWIVSMLAATWLSSDPPKSLKVFSNPSRPELRIFKATWANEKLAIKLEVSLMCCLFQSWNLVKKLINSSTSKIINFLHNISQLSNCVIDGGFTTIGSSFRKVLHNLFFKFCLNRVETYFYHRCDGGDSASYIWCYWRSNACNLIKDSVHHGQFKCLFYNFKILDGCHDINRDNINFYRNHILFVL